ncbi:MAG: transposase [bacterium]|nr:transposase [bacterium]
MERVYMIGADTHCAFTELAAISPGGRLVHRDRCCTTIRSLVQAVAEVRRPRRVVIEEGPLADWLSRGLSERGESVLVCDPRRNHLIAKDGDKDDAIDAEKLARLARGGFIKPVHHAESFDRVAFKRRVALYHDQVRHRVREANRLMAQCRQLGVFLHERDFAEAEQWRQCRNRLPNHKVVRADLHLLWRGYQQAVAQADRIRRGLLTLARKNRAIRRFTQVPGVAWIRAATFYAYVDTPFRFQRKQALWRYMGIGLERRGSGEGSLLVRVSRDANRTLKDMILGAAMSAVVSGRNPFAEQYRRWLQDGIAPRNARRNVARSQAAVMWGMWKRGDDYRPEWVGVAAGRPTVSVGQPTLSVGKAPAVLPT